MPRFAALALTAALLTFAACKGDKDKDTAVIDTDITVQTCDFEGQTLQPGETAQAAASCDTCTCADGAMTCTTEDADCTATEWCQHAPSTAPTCTALAGPGDTCAPVTAPDQAGRCGPDLTCVVPNGGTLGTCATCDYDTTPYQAGDVFTAADQCNTCTCGEDGSISCTEMACFAECHYLGQDYVTGDSFDSWDACNTCGCDSEGAVACTKIGCTGCRDSSEPYNCIVAPCSVSTCEVEGATCVDDYCGGCNALWFDTTGNSVCEGSAPR